MIGQARNPVSGCLIRLSAKLGNAMGNADTCPSVKGQRVHYCVSWRCSCVDF